MQGIQVATPAVLADLFSSTEKQQCGIASYLKKRKEKSLKKSLIHAQSKIRKDP